MKLKVGVIGSGHLGRWHVKMHTMLDSSEFIGVYDLDYEKASKVADEFGFSAYSDMDELISKCDALVIVTSTSTHYEIAKKCLLEGKHLFIEKPITATVEEGEELVSIAREKNLIVQVGHIERYNPAFFAIRDLKLDPKFIETHRLSQFNPRGTDVAVVLDLMIHDIDLILNLIDSPVKSIDASGVSVVTDNIDIANVRLKFENGATANVTASRISLKKMRKFRVFQKHNYITLDFDKGMADVFSLIDKDENEFEGIAVGEMEQTGKKVIYNNKSKVEINALLEENRDFIDSILHGKEVRVSGEDGVRALKVAVEIVDMINKQMQND